VPLVTGGNKKRKSGESSDRKRRPLTDTLVASIAIERFKGLSDSGSLTPIKTVAAKFDRDNAVISRAVARAFQDKLVAIVRKDKAEERKRLGALEDALLAKFGKLNKAIVIENLTGDSDESGAQGDPLKQPLQQKLGLAMARFIATDSALRNGDVIGVGSGRGVELTIHSLESCPQLRMQGVTLMSLTGSVYSWPNRKKGLWLDADRHVIEFAKYFKDEPKQYLICHPLAYEEEDLTKARRRTWLGDPKAPRPTMALLGVGKVAKEHRFYVEAEAEPADQEPFLKPIHTLLVTLKNLCKDAIESGRMIDKKGVKHRLGEAFPEYSPAAEMSNFFFFVPPPPESTIPNEQQVIECITKINKKLLNIQEEHLMSMQLMVVAGAKRKSHALRALLNSGYNVTYLCTDAEAATEIINGTA
jgi:DNA-binding transcriptional regulator LsrR (DeoR family)